MTTPMSATTRSEPKIHNTTELSIQRRAVKLALKKELQERQIWAPLASGWFNQWKKYVDFDEECVEQQRPEDALRSLHPGPIDNSILNKGAYGDELRRGMVENKDYILLPEDTFKMLIKEFTGGPNFCRKVLNKGTYYAPNCFVDLYPVRFEVYLCTKPLRFSIKPPQTGGNDPDIDNYTANTVKPDKIVYYPSSFNLNNFSDEMRMTMKVGDGSTRLWVKTPPVATSPSTIATAFPPPPPASTASTAAVTSTGVMVKVEGVVKTEHTEAEMSLSSHQYSHGGDCAGGGTSSKRARMLEEGEEESSIGRLMTSDITDLKGSPWRLLRNTQGLVAADLLGEQECLRILVEHHHERMIHDGEWPRQAVLQQWKRSLQIGDVVDAQDTKGNFYEAVITAVHSTNSDIDSKSSLAGSSGKNLGLPGLGVHFKGWGKDFDETISSEDVAKKIQPLYSKTTDWRGQIREDDEIEYRITAGPSMEECKAVWMKVGVVEVDTPAHRIAVQYSLAEAQKTMDEHGCDRGKVLFAASHPIPTNATTITTATALTTSNGVEHTNDDDVFFNDTTASMPMLVDQDKGTDETDVPGNINVDGDTTDLSSSSSNDVAATATATADVMVSAVVSVVSDDATTVMRWVDLHSEDICALYTHTIKPKPSYGTGYSSSSGYGYGKSSSYSSSYGSSNKDRLNNNEWGDKHEVGKPRVNGGVGLQNLGNTCFMNSILQCLSNTQPLTDIFLTNRYKSQLNIDNVLGHKGQLANVYARLLKDIWSDRYTKVVPREFKRTIGEFRPQFAGYDQQDSQELMNFLLDGLHEDLNRCKKKPFVAKIESKHRPDDLIARESWRRHLLRNDSEIVDRCFGLLKSDVTCTNCGYQSVTFDPYSVLSLPIPVKNTKPLSLFVRLLPIGSIPLKLEIQVAMTDNVAAVKRKAVTMLLDLGYLGVNQTPAMVTAPNGTIPSSGGSKSSGDGASSTPPPVGTKISFGGEGSTSSGSKTSHGSDQDYEFVNHDDATGQGLGLSLGLCSDEDLMMVVREGETAPAIDGKGEGQEEGQGEGEREEELDVDQVLDSYEKKFFPGEQDHDGSNGDSGGNDREVGSDDGRKVDTSEPFSEEAYRAARTAAGKNIRDGRLRNNGSGVRSRGESGTSGFLTTSLVTSNDSPTPTSRPKQCNAFATTYVNSQGNIPYLGLSFQLCTVKNTNKPDKTLADTAPVSDFMSSYCSEVLLLHQLAVDCPIKATISYSINEKDLPNTFVSYVDVCGGIRLDDRWSKGRLESLGLPVRVAMTKHTTCRDAHAMARDICTPYLTRSTDTKEGTGGAGKVTQKEWDDYTLLVSNLYCFDGKREVPKNSDELLNLAWSEVLFIAWHTEAPSSTSSSSSSLYPTPQLCGSHVNEFKRFKRVGEFDEDTNDNDGEDDDDKKGTSSFDKDKKFGIGVGVGVGTGKSTGAGKSTGKGKGKGKSGYTVQDCLDKFVEKEQMAPEETFFCSHCKQHLAPVKQLDLWTVPEVLILHLKRFQYSPGQYFVHREKINDLVDFPITCFDLSHYVKSPHNGVPPIYDLYAVSQHSGGLGGGHYTAVCQNHIDKNWYNFNDSWVSPTTPEQAVNEQAYVLFYRRRLPGPSTLPAAVAPGLGVGPTASVPGLGVAQGPGLGAAPSGSTTNVYRWGGILPLEGNGLPDEPEN